MALSPDTISIRTTKCSAAEKSVLSTELTASPKNIGTSSLKTAVSAATTETRTSTFLSFLRYLSAKTSGEKTLKSCLILISDPPLQIKLHISLIGEKYNWLLVTDSVCKHNPEYRLFS